jgi:MraZ protein
VEKSSKKVELCGAKFRSAMFRGISTIALDTKGRFAIPTKYRDMLASNENGAMVVTIDTEETCLLLYPQKEWLVIEAQLQKLPSFNVQARRVQRLLMGHATDIEIDGNGRLLLPPVLREYAHLDKNMVLIGQGNKFEVWSEALWNERRQAWLSVDNQGDEGLPDELKVLAL